MLAVMVRSVRAWGALLTLSVFAACSPSQNVVYCTPDETMCHGTCSALYKDPVNCGGCDTACDPGLVCSQGECVTNCGGGTIQCGQSCVQVKVDRANCGLCDTKCATLEACVNGSCSTSCASGQTMCVTTVAYCANLASDNSNCGGCGTKCAPESVCFDGKCSSECGGGQTLCAPKDAAAYCTDLSTDVGNCGTCQNVCNKGGDCVASKCGCPASAPNECSGACVDLMTDTNNCGECAAKCTVGTCGSGHCVQELHYTSQPANPITQDTSYVYWVEDDGRLWRGSKTSSSLKLLSSDALYALSITADATNVYWPNEGLVDFVPLNGGTEGNQSLATADASEVVTDSTAIYVARSDGIMSFPSGGGSTTTVIANESPLHSLSIVGTTLFWANDNFEIRSVHTDGTSEATLATMKSAIGRVTADSTNAYFTCGGDVIAVRADGSALPLVLVSGLSGLGHIATDGVDVYWMDASNLSRVPVGGGATSVITSTSGDAVDLVVDGTSIYWTTSYAVMKASK